MQSTWPGSNECSARSFTRTSSTSKRDAGRVTVQRGRLGRIQSTRSTQQEQRLPIQTYCETQLFTTLLRSIRSSVNRHMDVSIVLPNPAAFAMSEFHSVANPTVCAAVSSLFTTPVPLKCAVSTPGLRVTLKNYSVKLVKS